MIFTHNDFISSLHVELDRRPSKVWIGSFGLNVGISDAGKVYAPSDTFQIFQRITKQTTGSRMLIGVAKKPAHELDRKLIHSAEFFSTIQWKTRPDMHLKCWIFHHRDGTKRALVGGRNVGDSNWADLSIWVGNGEARRLVAFYETLWLKGKLVQTTKGLTLK